MKLLNFLLFLGLFATFNLTVAQTQQSSKIDVNTDIDLIKVYEQYVNDGYGTPAIYKKLANSNYFESNYAKAKLWYEKLFETERPISSTHRYRYKQSLKALQIDTYRNPYLSVAGINE